MWSTRKWVVSSLHFQYFYWRAVLSHSFSLSILTHWQDSCDTPAHITAILVINCARGHKTSQEEDPCVARGVIRGSPGLFLHHQLEHVHTSSHLQWKPSRATQRTISNQANQKPWLTGESPEAFIPCLTSESLNLQEVAPQFSGATS